MKAIYKEPTNCSQCSNMMDIFPDYVPDCVTCIKNSTKEVDVLQFGVGIFGNEAVVAFPDGTLKTVRVSGLTLRKE